MPGYGAVIGVALLSLESNACAGAFFNDDLAFNTELFERDVVRHQFAIRDRDPHTIALVGL
ncbi:hypothetical protein D3C87_2182980 [compost metagenome]